MIGALVRGGGAGMGGRVKKGPKAKDRGKKKDGRGGGGGVLVAQASGALLHPSTSRGREQPFGELFSEACARITPQTTPCSS